MLCLFGKSVLQLVVSRSGLLAIAPLCLANIYIQTVGDYLKNRVVSAQGDRDDPARPGFAKVVRFGKRRTRRTNAEKYRVLALFQRERQAIWIASTVCNNLSVKTKTLYRSAITRFQHWRP